LGSFGITIYTPTLVQYGLSSVSIVAVSGGWDTVLAIGKKGNGSCDHGGQGEGSKEEEKPSD
jgi:hypothetical protein